MSVLEEMNHAVAAGDEKSVERLVTEALDAGVAPLSISTDGLLPGMICVGGAFRNGQAFVPEMLVAARAMHRGLRLLEPLVSTSDRTHQGTVVLGTIKGDLHDIGKKLVSLMMQSRGLDVVDLGVDVSAESFLKAATEHEASVIGCSALLTSTVPEMERLVRIADERELRPGLRILIGGAPVTEDYRRHIGADAFGADAMTGSEIALALCQRKTILDTAASPPPASTA